MKSMKAILAIVMLLPLLANAQTLVGTVSVVHDGDTLTVAGQKVRLAGIDAPELKQLYGTQSRDTLARLTGKKVTVDWHKHDKYGRLVGKVIYYGRDQNLRQVKLGSAWYYKAYGSELKPADQILYQQAEQKARTSRVGLWANPNPEAPWDFRHKH